MDDGNRRINDKAALEKRLGRLTSRWLRTRAFLPVPELIDYLARNNGRDAFAAAGAPEVFKLEIENQIWSGSFDAAGTTVILLSAGGTGTSLDAQAREYSPENRSDLIMSIWLRHDVCRAWFERRGYVWSSRFDGGATELNQDGPQPAATANIAGRKIRPFDIANYERISELLQSGEALSVRAAALALVKAGKVAGSGLPESKAKRLERGYRAWKNSGP